jgi:hypothetical protein
MWTSEVVRFAMLGNLKWISAAFLAFGIFPFFYKLYLKTKIVIDPNAQPILRIDAPGVVSAPSPARGKKNPSRLVPLAAAVETPESVTPPEVPAVQYIYPDNTENHGKGEEEKKRKVNHVLSILISCFLKGVILKLRAKKPADFVITKASLYIDDESTKKNSPAVSNLSIIPVFFVAFWDHMRSQYGSGVISIARMVNKKEKYFTFFF